MNEAPDVPARNDRDANAKCIEWFIEHGGLRPTQIAWAERQARCTIDWIRKLNIMSDGQVFNLQQYLRRMHDRRMREQAAADRAVQRAKQRAKQRAEKTATPLLDATLGDTKP